MTELIKITKATNTHLEKKKTRGNSKMEEFFTLDTASTGEFFPERIFFLNTGTLTFLPVCYTNNSLTQHGI